jgi:hypothetical protein
LVSRVQPHLTLRVLPFAVIVAVSLTDLVAGPSLGFLPLLTLGPTFASVYGRSAVRAGDHRGRP